MRVPHPQVQARPRRRRRRGGRPPTGPHRRPRPALTQDNAFFFEGAKEHSLLIQRCAVCGTLRHPPRPACANCRSFEWDALEASGRGTIYSFVVNHYPQVPAFDYPLVVALIELEEGTRLVANVVGITPETVAIGMPVVATFVAFDDDLTLPVFRPAPDAAGTARTDDEEELMDFTFSEEQHGGARGRRRASSRAGRPRTGSRRSRPPRTASTGRCGRSWPRPTCWGCAVPEAYGGGGSAWSSWPRARGPGTVVAPVPLWATVVLGALPIAEFGSERAAGRPPSRRGRR